MDRIMYADAKRKAGLIIWTMAILTLLFACFFHDQAVKASEASISVKEINYFDSTITLQVNSGDTEVYFSDSKKKTWETVPGEISSANTITLDISWIPTVKNYVITFKANKSTGIISVTLPKQADNFKASFNKVKNTVSFKNAGTRTIEWRKNGSTVWNIVNTATLSTELSYLYNNGATVYFRLAPVNGTAITNVGSRASKEVAVAIPKKDSAPQITIDGSRFSIAVKKGMAYRTVNSDGTYSDWHNINSSTELLLKNIASNVLFTNSSTPRTAVTLQFRTNATSSSQVSKISTITVPVQEGPPDRNTCGISLSYTSSSTVSLQVKAASTVVPFEYTIVKQYQELNYQTAVWTAISSNTAVDFDKKSAPIGCHIYVRKKSLQKTDTVSFTLASVEIEVTEASGLVYPDAPTASTLTTLISTAGVCRTEDSLSYLSFRLYSSTSTTVSSINLKDSYGISKGTVTCSSTVAKNADSTRMEDKYIITTKITSTEAIDAVTEKKLYAELTLANSDVITSSDTAGVILYLYPKTTVNNPTKAQDPNDEFASTFNRIYMSKDTNDDSYFKFKLDLGTKFVPESSKIDSFTSNPVEIKTLKYDGYTLNYGTDYSVDYASNEDKTVATATVTVKVSNFEENSLIDITDTEVPLRITLTNGETLNNAIFIKLVNTAIIDEAPIAWSITEKSLKPETTKTITNSDGSKETITEDLINFTITLTLFDKAYGVGISDVTWGGISILQSTEISNGKATIYLSNKKINLLTTDSTDTKNIVITLSNGFVIKSGCKLTILNAL